MVSLIGIIINKEVASNDTMKLYKTFLWFTLSEKLNESFMIVRLRRDLNRLHEASESRIQCLKNRLNAFTEEAFHRRTIEMKVSQLHTAALKYANQLAELTPINKLHGCDEVRNIIYIYKTLILLVLFYWRK
ncbi:unnamed protein product [Trichobilharzia regenti]|nr:unnamed protein product [Trichobilharzia regenti]